MTKLYIAYGSNLNQEQMKRRCPTARPLGKFKMKDARLAFRVYADLDLVQGETVPCALWSVNQADIESLDSYEGAGLHRAYCKEWILIQYLGRPRKAFLYIMSDGAGYAPPTDEYVKTLRKGYQDFGMDERYLNKAIKYAHDHKEHTSITRARLDRAKARGHRVVAQVPTTLRRQSDLLLPPITLMNGGDHE